MGNDVCNNAFGFESYKKQQSTDHPATLKSNVLSNDTETPKYQITNQNLPFFKCKVRNRTKIIF